MIGFVLRTLITALGLWAAASLIPGVHIESTGTMIWAAILLGIVNAIIRPVAVILTLPLTLISLGGFLLVVNAAMFGLVAALLDSFHVSGFFAALFGALIVSITSWVGSSFIGPDGRYEVMVIRRD
ncbi:MAG: phage holin family protein [Pseudomonadales bacterium]|nr:phage holin family protein [Pseudomonadales bacterium]NIX09926.1 phage holin family protein [Pseudomonadales bacterium]